MAADDVRFGVMMAPNVEVAESIVHALVEERLIACGNIVPGATSIYRWRGAIERESEVLVLMKTTAAASSRLIERISALHPYEVPEVLLLPITAGHVPYLGWVADSVGSWSGENGSAS